MSADRIAVVGNGVDAAYFEQPMGSSSCESRQGPYVLTIGGLTRRKAGDLVLRVAAALDREGCGVRVLVAGQGEAAFDAPAAALPNVALLGFVETSRMVELLRGAVAVLVLSRYEGFGMPVIEAMAAGAPVISSRFAALPEVVGDAGLLVDAENTGEVVAAIQTLLTDSGAHDELRMRGRKRAQAYHWDRCVVRVAEALKNR